MRPVALRGTSVVLRTAVMSDLDRLVTIRSTPEVRSRWRGEDLVAEVSTAITSSDLHLLAIEDADGAVLGAIQWDAEEDLDYSHASVDIFLDPAVHGRGVGADAVRTLVTYLFDVEGHHRVVIDPASDNVAAIRCYRKVGFREVGVMRQYERGPDDTWHDGLLMELLADDLWTAGSPE
jgi:aminoglycoside 6'-N-acetyltransferase